MEIRVEVMINNPEFILLEDQNNTNSGCFVLDVSQSEKISANI